MKMSTQCLVISKKASKVLGWVMTIKTHHGKHSVSKETNDHRLPWEMHFLEMMPCQNHLKYPLKTKLMFWIYVSIYLFFLFSEK